jgi:hypothetical protein
MNIERTFEKSGDLLLRMEELRLKKAWLPRVFRNWFQNTDGIHALTAELAAKQTVLMRELFRQTSTRDAENRSVRLEAENKVLREEIDKMRKLLVRSASDSERPHEMFYFMHIPKTAGVSVETYLKEVFKPDEVLPVFYPKELSETPQAELRRHKLVLGHMFGLPDTFLGLKTRKATFLRHPFDRAVSGICHAQRYQNHKLYDVVKGRSIEDILCDPSLAWMHSNYQARHIATLAFSVYSLIEFPVEGHSHPYHTMERLFCELFSGDRLYSVAEDMLSQFDFVGLTEQMELSLECLADAWNLPAPNSNYNLNRNPKREDYKNLVSENAYSWFQSRNEADFKLYDLIKRQLAEKRAMSPQAVAA